MGTVMEMSDPTWDQPGGRLSFTATVADWEEGDEPLPWLMADVALFIDDSGSAYKAAKLAVNNASPGQAIAIELTSEESQTVSWSLGPDRSEGSGFALSSESGAVPLASLSVTPAELRLQTAPEGSGSAMSFEVTLFLELSPGATLFYARSASDPGVNVQLSFLVILVSHPPKKTVFKKYTYLGYCVFL